MDDFEILLFRSDGKEAESVYAFARCAKKKKKRKKGLIARSRVVIREAGLGSGLFGSSLSLQPWRFPLCVFVYVCVSPFQGLSSALYQSHYEIVCVLANPRQGARLFTVDQPLPSITFGSYQHYLATHSPLLNWKPLTEFSSQWP